MSPKVRNAIAMVLAVLLLVNPTSYAYEAETTAVAITGQQIADLDDTEAETEDTIEKSAVPLTLLVGIDTLKIIAPELEEYISAIIGGADKTEPEIWGSLMGAIENKVEQSVSGNGTGAEPDDESEKAPENGTENDPENGAGTDSDAETGSGDEVGSGDADEDGEGDAAVETEPEEIIPSIYDGIAVVTVLEEYLNVRADASAEASLVGRMYPGTKGTILEEKNGWYHITSGNVDGWISGKYAVTGREAEAFIKEHMTPKVMVTTEVLNVRTAPNTDGAFLGYVKMGETYEILGEENGWYLVEFTPGRTGYISGKYISLTTSLGNGMTNAEVAAYEYQHSLAAKADSIGAELRGKISATEEEIYLLAALCRHEAGRDDYLAALAVANCVINRIHNGYWGTDIRGIIFAPGQFQYVEDGALDKWMYNSGPNCLQAAKDTLAGINNAGDYIFFHSEKGAEYEKYERWTNIGGNVFYWKYKK